MLSSLGSWWAGWQSLPRAGRRGEGRGQGADRAGVVLLLLIDRLTVQ